MEYIEALVKLLAGLGAFLIAFKILSENIEKLANDKLKKVFNKTGKNRFFGVGIGALITAIIQSSSAATVMIVGFVNAGLLSLFQATAMIMGANIGTTITAQIVALNSFDIGLYAMLFAFVGAFMNMLAKNNKIKTIGLMFAGLGLVFLALNFMSDAMSIFKTSKAFTDLLQKIDNPFLLLLIGVGFTALIQSSSATTTIIIQMVSAGLVIGGGGNSILYVVLGSNIGTCVTALLSSIGATPNAKRASLIHLMFNVFGTILFFIVLLCWKDFMDMTFARWFSQPATQIAMFHTFFNVVATIIFLPIINVFVKLANIIIRDKKTETVSIVNIDERFLKTPAIAISQVTKETVRLGSMAMDTLDLSIDGFLNKSLESESVISSSLEKIESISRDVLAYLVKISSADINPEDEKYISKLHKIINDFYREAEIADNMVKYTRNTLRDNLEFSDKVYDQIRIIKGKLKVEFDYIKNMFEKQDYSGLKELDILEDEIDEMRSSMINEHIKRLEAGACSPSNCGVYINLVSNLERAGDHLNYIAHALVSSETYDDTKLVENA